MSFDLFDRFEPVERARSRAESASPSPAALTSAALTQLDHLLAAAADLEVEDHEGWAVVRAAAHHVVAVAIASGAVPAHLAVDPADPPARVARTLTAASRRVSRSPSMAR